MSEKLNTNVIEADYQNNIDTEINAEWKSLEEAEAEYKKDITYLAELLPDYSDIDENAQAEFSAIANELGSNDIKVGVANYLTRLNCEKMRLENNRDDYLVYTGRNIARFVMTKGYSEDKKAVSSEINKLDDEISKYMPEGYKDEDDLDDDSDEFREMSADSCLFAATLTYMSINRNYSDKSITEPLFKSDIELVGTK